MIHLKFSGPVKFFTSQNPCQRTNVIFCLRPQLNRSMPRVGWSVKEFAFCAVLLAKVSPNSNLASFTASAREKFKSYGHKSPYFSIPVKVLKFTKNLVGSRVIWFCSSKQDRIRVLRSRKYTASGKDFRRHADRSVKEVMNVDFYAVCSASPLGRRWADPLHVSSSRNNVKAIQHQFFKSLPSFVEPSQYRTGSVAVRFFAPTLAKHQSSHTVYTIYFGNIRTP